MRTLPTMRCPKCGSRNTETYHEQSSWAWTGNRKPDRIFHCSSCGLLLYGDAAEKVVAEARPKTAAPTPTPPEPVQRTRAPVVAVTDADLERARNLTAQMQAFRQEAKDLRRRTRPDNDDDLLINLTVIDANKAILELKTLPKAKTVEEKNAAFQQADLLMEAVKSRLEHLRALPELPAPVTVEVPAVVEVVSAETQKCAWAECTNPASGTSNYCSVDCRNKNARQRFKDRQAAQAPPEPAPTPPPPPVQVGPDAAFAEMVRQFRAKVGIPAEPRLPQAAPNRGKHQAL